MTVATSAAVKNFVNFLIVILLRDVRLLRDPAGSPAPDLVALRKPLEANVGDFTAAVVRGEAGRFTGGGSRRGSSAYPRPRRRPRYRTARRSRPGRWPGS